jgi:Icc-related predicted phosphoesterase
MRVLTVAREPLHALDYVSPDGSGLARCRFDIRLATVDRLPADCDALFACSDLQGRVGSSQGYRLMGEVVAEELASLCGAGARRIGVMLCGDLYVRPKLDRRAGVGDVRPVWRAFARRFRWVVGVAGNHDAFGNDPTEVARFQTEPGIHLLDSRTVELGGLRIAGLGGIIGNPLKPQCRRKKDYVGALERLLGEEPDLVLLHQGPDIPGEGLAGHRAIRRAIRRTSKPLVVCGHSHWKTPLASIGRGPQVLNLEARGLLLVRR